MNKKTQSSPQVIPQVAPAQDSGDVAWSEPVVGPPLEFKSEQEARSFLDGLSKSGPKGNTSISQANKPEDTEETK